MQSIIQQRGQVLLPKFNGDRVYMVEFFKDKALPSEVKRWQTIVDQMLEGVDVEGPMYLMVDQAFVKAGQPHLRPGVHIDGYWNPALSAHRSGGHTGSGGGSYTPRPPSHSGVKASGSYGGHRGINEGWDFTGVDPKKEWEPEPVLLLSDVAACKAYVGEYFDFPKEGGDCSHVDVSSMKEVVLEPNVVYAANVTCLHESIPVKFDCLRTVVHINVPNWRM